MIRRQLLNVALAACVTAIPSSSCAIHTQTAATSDATRQTVDLLLSRENEALDRFQQSVVPALRCDQNGKEARQICHDMRGKLSDEARLAKQDIARYQTSIDRPPVELFRAYVDLEQLLNDIQIVSIEDEYTGNGNRQALAEGYNSFIKLTGAWFTGVMGDVIRASEH